MKKKKKRKSFFLFFFVKEIILGNVQRRELVGEMEVYLLSNGKSVISLLFGWKTS